MHSLSTNVGTHHFFQYEYFLKEFYLRQLFMLLWCQPQEAIYTDNLLQRIMNKHFFGELVSMYNKMPSTYTRAWFLFPWWWRKKRQKTGSQQRDKCSSKRGFLPGLHRKTRFLLENQIQSNTPINNLSFHAKVKAFDVLSCSSSLHHRIKVHLKLLYLLITLSKFKLRLDNTHSGLASYTTIFLLCQCPIS